MFNNNYSKDSHTYTHSHIHSHSHTHTHTHTHTHKQKNLAASWNQTSISTEACFSGRRSSNRAIAFTHSRECVGLEMDGCEGRLTLPKNRHCWETIRLIDSMLFLVSNNPFMCILSNTVDCLRSIYYAHALQGCE